MLKEIRFQNWKSFKQATLYNWAWFETKFSIPNSSITQSFEHIHSFVRAFACYGCFSKMSSTFSKTNKKSQPLLIHKK